MTTVGTSFSVSHGGAIVRAGTLGSDDIVRLPAGDYLISLDSNPPTQALVALESEVRHTVVFSASLEGASHTSWRDSAEYSACDEALVALEEAPSRAVSPPAAPAAADPSPEVATIYNRVVPEAPKAEPKARREVSFQVEGGTVEVWRNLRARRTSDFAVLVRHASVGSGPRMIYRGNDFAVAEATAVSARDTLRAGGSLDLPDTP